MWIWGATATLPSTRSLWNSLMGCGRTGAKTVIPRWSTPTTLCPGMKSTPPAMPRGRSSLRCILIHPQRWSHSKYTRPLVRQLRRTPHCRQSLLVRYHLLHLLLRVLTFLEPNPTRRRPKFSKLTRTVVAVSSSPVATVPTPLFHRCTLRSKTPPRSLLASYFRHLPPFPRSPSRGLRPPPLCHLPLIWGSTPHQAVNMWSRHGNTRIQMSLHHTFPHRLIASSAWI